MPNPVTERKEREKGMIEPKRALSLFDEMEQWAERMMPWRPFRFDRQLWANMPAIDILDREADVLVRAAVPGFTKDDIEVTTTNDAVTIRGKTRKTEETKEDEYYRREMHYEDFLRTVHLPSQVDDSKAKATFKDGVLEVELPKVAVSKRNTLKID